ncbi:MAG: glycoside hydrolase family 95 protein [Clostridia bacterium]|nr:glycoside hydrolase family 95 protein [Clostridia bacterium]
MKDYILRYNKQTPLRNDELSLRDHRKCNIPEDGWERWSLPIGNGLMGINIFGRTDTERLLVTENSLSNPCTYHDKYPGGAAGLSNFCSIYLDFGHIKVKNYSRSLSLNTALCKTEYIHKGVSYKREHFASYPDNVFVTKITAGREKALSFGIRTEISLDRPYLFEEGDKMGKVCKFTYDNDTIVISGKMLYYNILFEGRLKVITDGGSVKAENSRIKVSDCSTALIIFTCGTNYRSESKVFTEKDPKKKLEGFPAPYNEVKDRIEKASKLSYNELYERHLKDYFSLFGAADISLSEEAPDINTDKLLREYRRTKNSPYLEELTFQYGRYLLISSSRPGGRPANLQGIWNRYDSSPWSAGYWHNINVQMNYWPSFNTNLHECFIPYIEYFNAYKALAKENADEYIKKYFPENFSEDNGIAIATGGWLYDMESLPDPQTGHSGAGTGAFTVKLFDDYYEFTGDKEFLRETGFYALYEMSVLLSKILERQEDGTLLSKYSASPEQCHNDKYYHTKGCAFDQQMIFQCWKDTVKAAEALGFNDSFISYIKENIGRLSPVEIGLSGQIKEFREEKHYGDIGEKHHRHISHLVGLYPGDIITSENSEWIKAAEVTLNKRGDKSTGWSTAHKLNLWARAKNGNRAYDLVKTALSKCMATNLWDLHPPFQIDGNFGFTAGVAEMLIQSHEGFIEILPAIPDKWSTGSFTGLTARGGFTVSASWTNSRVNEITVVSASGNPLKIKVNGKIIEEKTEKGKEYKYTL